MLCQLLSSLSSLHYEEKKLVYRDLKIEILLVHDDTIGIADFVSIRMFSEATDQAPASKHSILFRPPV
jgi:serine/threonine protein kinase